MTKKLTPITEALTRLGDAVKASNTSNTTLRQNNGWNFPNLTAANIAKLAYSLRDRIARIDPATVDSKFNVDAYATRIDEETANLPQYFWNGNGAEAFRAYTALLDWLEATFANLFVIRTDWESLAKDEKMPGDLAKKTRALAARIKTVTASVSTLDDQVKAINAAHDAALSLPTDLETLNEAREAVAAMSKDAERDASTVAANADVVKQVMADLQQKKEEAVQLVKRTEDAYSAATTMGLGAAFETRARSLAWSMWVWVGGLLVALIAGSVIGWFRISLVEDLIKSNGSATAIWLNTFLSFLSIAAPVWFAWIATKQIGQRFRLAEDYAFKASVAKAYEGYRREAASIDPSFAQRLFSSALDRLEEAPLRFVEHETHGSPWHEALKFGGKKAEKSEGVPAGASITPRPTKPADIEMDEEAEEG